MTFLVRLVVNGLAIWLTTFIIDGIDLPAASTTGEQVLTVAVVALVFTLVNMIVRPVVALLSLPFYILTLGLFFVVVNALMLMLTGWITGFTDFGLVVDGFVPALLGGLVIAVAAWILHALIPGDHR